jgi:hypothetical protein
MPFYDKCGALARVAVIADALARVAVIADALARVAVIAGAGRRIFMNYSKRDVLA